MITVRTSPQYVNRVRQDWTANGGVYGDDGVYAVTSSNDPFAQTGPTFDLVFAGTATDPLDAATTTDDTLALNFVAQAYQIAAQYVVWSDYQINYALLPSAILSASVNIEPQKTLFKDTLIGGRPLGDISNDGSVTSEDSLAYTSFNSAPWLNTVAENDYIRTVLNPYMLANPGLYAAYLSPGPLANKTFADVITFTRASTATYFNSAGTLTTAAINEARFDFSPSTLAAQGLLIEEQRTNSIRNNTMQGAVAGTPGTLPTNWVTGGSGLGTLTREIIGTGTSNGITYIDIRFSGTTSTTGFVISTESNTSGPAASVGQTWTLSNFFAMVGGSTTNITALRAGQIFGRDAGGAASGDTFSGADIKSSVTSTLTRFTVSGTIAQATTATLQPMVAAFSFASGVAIDITLRIGLPQLELGAFATSVIPTTTTALTRSADVASVNTLSPWYNASEGTIYLEFTPVGMKSIATQTVMRIDDNTESNRISFGATSTNAMSNSTIVSGSTSGNNTTPLTTYAANSTYKIAFAVRLDDVQSFSGGSAGTIDTTALIPSGLSVLRFAANTTDVICNAWFRRLTYYPRRLSQADGIIITT